MKPFEKEAQAVVFAWLRQAPTGIQMMSDRKYIDPLIAAFDEALAAAFKAGVESMREKTSYLSDNPVRAVPLPEPKGIA